MLRKQIMKFIVIGVFSTIVNYALFYTCYEFFSIYYTLSSALGFMTGVFAGYGLNKNWTFGVKEKSYNYVYKYAMTYTISLFLGLLFLEFLVKGLGIIPEIANALTIGLTTCTNFMGTKFWVFRTFPKN